jgi:hypothetical protein
MEASIRFLTSAVCWLALSLTLLPLPALGDSDKPQTILDKFLAITDKDMEKCQIKAMKWVAPVGKTPYAQLVYCENCSNAEYDANGVITNLNTTLVPSLQSSYPTSAIARIPEGFGTGDPTASTTPNGLIGLTLIGGSLNDHRFFSAPVQAIVQAGIALNVTKLPDFGDTFGPTPNMPVKLVYPTTDAFQAAWDPNNYRKGYLAISRNFAQCIVHGLFGIELKYHLGYGISAGVSRGIGIMNRDGEVDESPFNGVVMVVGGGGTYRAFLRIQGLYRDPSGCMTSYGTLDTDNCVLVNGVPALDTSTAPSSPYGFLNFAIGDVADVFGGLALGSDFAAPFLYSIEAQSGQIQRNWSRLEYGTTLPVPTFVLNGALDPSGSTEAISFLQRVVAQGPANSAMKHFYFFKGLTHDQTGGVPVQSANPLRRMIQYLDTGIASPITAGSGASIRTAQPCETLGYGDDPLACAIFQNSQP